MLMGQMSTMGHLPSWSRLGVGGMTQIPQELSREHNVCAGEGRRTRPGDSHLQAWPGTYGIQSHGAVGLWPPTERVALVLGMLCTLKNEPWRMECEQIAGSEAHEGKWSMHAQGRKMLQGRTALVMTAI
jgi:hypothetical protein